MLKNKMLKNVAAVLGAVMLLSAAGTGAVFADGDNGQTAEAEGKAVTYKFTQGNQYADAWFESSNFSKSTNGSPFYGWYEAGSTSSMIFCFDGSKSTTVDGKTYNMDGTPKEIRYLQIEHSNATASKKYYVSSDKKDWTEIKTFTSGSESYTGTVSDRQNWLNGHKKSEYPFYSEFYKNENELVNSWANHIECVITVPEKFIADGDSTNTFKNTKYVKVELDKTAGNIIIAKPTITYEVLRRGFDVKNGSMVYPNKIDLKLDFDVAMDDSTVTKDNFTVIENVAEGQTAQNPTIESITYDSEKNTASFTFKEPLKPCTTYTITASDSVKTANGNSLNESSASFSTISKDFSQKTEEFKDTTYDGKWFEGFTSGSKTKGYWCDYKKQFTFSFDGSKSVTQDNKTYKFSGIPTEVSFSFADNANNLTAAENTTITFKNSNDDVIKNEKLTPYCSNIIWNAEKLPNGLKTDTWRGIIEVKIPSDSIPRDTAKITVNKETNSNSTYMFNPSVKWNHADKYETEASAEKQQDGTINVVGGAYFNFDGTKKTADFTVITAAYDNNGVLTDISVDTYTDVNKWSLKTIHKTLKGEKARIFMFDSTSTLKPLSVVYQ